MNEMVMKLDQWGLPAWIGLMVVSFILVWPVGLAVLAFLLWSGRMGCGTHANKGRWPTRFANTVERKAQEWSNEVRAGFGGSSGNKAFDEYRESTLRRLEEEQREFRAFLDNLRHAKDRAEFDEFMANRKNAAAGGAEPGGNPQTV